MRELAYVEVKGIRTYCIFPYYCTTDTSIVFNNLYIPVQTGVSGGINICSEGPGRFQGTGDCLEFAAPIQNTIGTQVIFRNYRNTNTIYYQVEYQEAALDGKVEIGNAYLKINNQTVATGTPWTGGKVTLPEPFYLFDHFYQGWSNYIRSGHCGQVIFYESGVETARFTPYQDDDNRVGFLNEQTQTMIYPTKGSWTAGPDASSITARASKATLAATGETINIEVNSENAWTLSTSGDSFLTLSSTGGTSGETTITATAPSYTGATAREEYITFTDSVTSDAVELTIKQKRYISGQPLYLGADEITEIYLGTDAISEAYLGEDLVFSSTPESGSTSGQTSGNTNSVLTIQYMNPDMGVASRNDVELINGGTQMDYITWEDDGGGTVTITQTTNSPFSATTSGDDLIIVGPFLNPQVVNYSHTDSDMSTCVSMMGTESITFVNGSATTEFSTERNTDMGCECAEQGGEWDSENEECIYPEDPCGGDPCCEQGITDPDECECFNQGGWWDGTECHYDE